MQILPAVLVSAQLFVLSFFFLFASLFGTPPFLFCSLLLPVITLAKTLSQALKHLIDFSLAQAVIGF